MSGAGVHRYHARCRWSGSTADGYEAYDRTHVVEAPPARARLTLSSDPAFRGDAAQLNPEQLLVLAASSCQLLAFLAVAARAGGTILAYDDEAEGEMPEDDRPMRLTRIVLRPRVTVAPGVAEDRVRHWLEVGHRECYIANSLRTEITLEPTVVVAHQAG